MLIALAAAHDLLLEVLREDHVRGWVGPSGTNGWTVLSLEDAAWADGLDGSVPYFTATDGCLTLVVSPEARYDWYAGQDPEAWARAASAVFAVPAVTIAAALFQPATSADGLFEQLAAAAGIPDPGGATLDRSLALVSHDPELARALAQASAPILLVGPQGAWTTLVPRAGSNLTADALARAAARLQPEGRWAVAIERTGPRCVVTVATPDTGSRALTVPAPGWTDLAPPTLTMADHETVRSILRISDRPEDAERLQVRLDRPRQDLNLLDELVTDGFLPPVTDLLRATASELGALGELISRQDGKPLSAYERTLKGRERTARAAAAPRQSTGSNLRTTLGFLLRLRSMALALFGLVALLTGVALFATGHHHTGQSGVRGTPIGLTVIGLLSLVGGMRRAFRH